MKKYKLNCIIFLVSLFACVLIVQTSPLLKNKINQSELNTFDIYLNNLDNYNYKVNFDEKELIIYDNISPNQDIVIHGDIPNDYTIKVQNISDNIILKN